MDNDPLKATYQALARGDAKVPDDRRVVDALLERVFEARRSPRVEDRLEALKVAEAIGDRAGLDLIETFMADPDLRVRQHTFRLGVQAGRDGLPIVREAAGDSDAELSLAALKLLTVAADKAATTRARTLVGHSDARIRAAAIRLLGHIAGPSVRRELSTFEADPDEDVRLAVVESVERLDGKRPKNRPGQWWESPQAATFGAAQSVSPDGALPDNSVPPKELATLNPDSVPSGKGPYDSTWGPEMDSDEPLWAAPLNEDESSLQPGTAWDGTAELPLPDTLPSQAYGVLRLLGQVASEHHATVAKALESVDKGALHENVKSHQSGKDPARGRGIALAARYLDKKSWLNAVRPLLGDPEPLVRVAAVQAVGALGGPSTLTQLSGRLSDKSAVVRKATIETLGEACLRWNLAPILPQWLEQVENDPDAGVQAARAAALAKVESAEGK